MAKTLVNSQEKNIPTYFTRILLRILNEDGINPEKLFDRLQISAGEFINDDYRITFDEHKIFIKNAISVTQDPHLGWRFGNQINITALGMVGHAVMASDNVSSAIKTLCDYFKLRAPSYDLELQNALPGTNAGTLLIKEESDFDDVRYFMLTVVVSGFDNIFRFLTQKTHYIRRVELTCEEPEGWQNQVKLIDYPVSFNASATKLYLDSDFLQRPMPTADPDTEKSANRVCQDMLGTIENQTGIISEVKQFILKCSGRYPSLNDTANYLCISSRTLRRELNKSNTTYQQLLDSIRTSIAKELLLNTTKSVTEIAYELGFNDASNFNRAFKSWAGKTPGKFRK